jgi:DivIVA domain-containing protein
MFTPEDIEGRSFVMVRRGYDADEVGAFLRAVAEDVRRLQDEVAVAKRNVDPLDGAMADAVAIVQSARETAAKINANAEQRAAERIRDLEEEVAGRLERARAEARAQLDEARDAAAAVMAEISARKTEADAEIASARNTWLRELAELDVLSRRRRNILEEAQDSLEQWMGALRDIVVEAKASATTAPEDEAAYPSESVAEIEVPQQESEHHEEHHSYDGA